MCLVNPQKLNQTQDVVCYKIFYKRADNNLFYKIINKLFYGKTLFSAFKCAVYRLGCTKKLNINEPYVLPYHFSSLKRIEGNSLHSFVTFEDAFNFLKNDYEMLIDNLRNRKLYTPCIVQCKIPKNSKFLYKGIFEGKDNRIIYQSYASERLVPEEIVAELIKNND